MIIVPRPIRRTWAFNWNFSMNEERKEKLVLALAITRPADDVEKTEFDVEQPFAPYWVEEVVVEQLYQSL